MENDGSDEKCEYEKGQKKKKKKRKKSKTKKGERKGKTKRKRKKKKKRKKRKKKKRRRKEKDSFVEDSRKFKIERSLMQGRSISDILKENTFSDLLLFEDEHILVSFTRGVVYQRAYRQREESCEIWMWDGRSNELISATNIGRKYFSCSMKVPNFENEETDGSFEIPQDKLFFLLSTYKTIYRFSIDMNSKLLEHESYEIGNVIYKMKTIPNRKNRFFAVSDCTKICEYSLFPDVSPLKEITIGEYQGVETKVDLSYSRNYDGNFYVSGISDNNEILQIDYETSLLDDVKIMGRYTSHRGDIHCLEVFLNNQTEEILVAGSESSVLYFYHTKTKYCMKRVVLGESPINHLKVLGYDEKLLVTLRNSERCSIFHLKNVNPVKVCDIFMDEGNPKVSTRKYRDSVRESKFNKFDGVLELFSIAAKNSYRRYLSNVGCVVRKIRIEKIHVMLHSDPKEVVLMDLKERTEYVGEMLFEDDDDDDEEEGEEGEEDVRNKFEILRIRMCFGSGEVVVFKSFL